MNDGTAFIVLVTLIAAYVIVGNVVYLGSAVPYLVGKGRIKGASFMPSEQFKHMHEYAVESQKDCVSSFPVAIASNFMAISVALTVVVLLSLLLLALK